MIFKVRESLGAIHLAMMIPDIIKLWSMPFQAQVVLLNINSIWSLVTGDLKFIQELQLQLFQCVQVIPD